MGNMGKLVSYYAVVYLKHSEGIIYLVTLSKALLSSVPLLFKSSWSEHKGFTE